MLENDQNPELELWKKRAPQPEPDSGKPKAPEAEPELRNFYEGSDALNNPRGNRAHRRSRVKNLTDELL